MIYRRIKHQSYWLKGTGNLKGSSVGYKDIEFTFVEKKGENIYFSDSLHLEQVRINKRDQ